ncbi:MAG: DUF6323 family protein [Bacillota bacterium]|nr:DUF6323 family protein [Bacillota bacterium]
MNTELMYIMKQDKKLEILAATNKTSGRFGLVLSPQDALMIAEEEKNTLKEHRRIELGEGIAPRIIYEFCDSAYIDQQCYAETIVRLQEIFYIYKNEMLDNISDEELLCVMKEFFEYVCRGDLDFLENTCLADFAEAVRAGYDGYKISGGRGEYRKFAADYDDFIEEREMP